MEKIDYKLNIEMEATCTINSKNLSVFAKTECPDLKDVENFENIEVALKKQLEQKMNLLIFKEISKSFEKLNLNDFFNEDELVFALDKIPSSIIISDFIIKKAKELSMKDLYISGKIGIMIVDSPYMKIASVIGKEYNNLPYKICSFCDQTNNTDIDVYIDPNMIWNDNTIYYTTKNV